MLTNQSHPKVSLLAWLIAVIHYASTALSTSAPTRTIGLYAKRCCSAEGIGLLSRSPFTLFVCAEPSKALWGKACC